MGLLRAPIETVWYDAVDTEVVAGTVRFTLLIVEKDEDGCAIRRPLIRVITSIEAAEQNNADIAGELMRSGRSCSRTARRIAGNWQ